MSKNFKKYFKKHLHFDEITLWLNNNAYLTTKDLQSILPREQVIILLSGYPVQTGII